jgi:hypothetical protein
MEAYAVDMVVKTREEEGLISGTREEEGLISGRDLRQPKEIQNEAKP